MKDVTLDMSKLHKWSIGIVIKDIEYDSDIIEVYPVEKIPDENINLWKKNEFKETITNTYPKDNEKKDSEEVINLTKSVSIKAMWLGEDQFNRMTPPTIRKEEYVQIYRYSNADVFFWDTLRNDARLRKEEVVVHAYSDKPDIDMNETLDNMVYQKIDTLNKIIHFHTPDNNGGYTTYDITLDYGKGYLEILDGKQNQIKLDSNVDKFNMHIEGTTNKYDITVDGDNGFVETVDNKGNSIKLDSPSDTISVKTNTKVVVDTKNAEVNAKDITFNTSTFNINASTVSYNGGTIKHDGVSIDKTHTHTGNQGFPVSVPNN